MISFIYSLFWPVYDQAKAKQLLGLAHSRLKLQISKHSNKTQAAMREVAVALQAGHCSVALTKARYLGKDEDHLCALEIVIGFVDQMQRLLPSLANSNCPEGSVEVVSTVVWSAAYLNVPELMELRKQLQLNLGEAMMSKMISDEEMTSNRNVVRLLDATLPTDAHCQSMLNFVSNKFETPLCPCRCGSCPIAEALHPPPTYDATV
eukprot:TRINITY_DN1368_c0_g1_i1.p1 TRINITY_DN1368_c0_g1~~TRINITY_DN1368_c0_g1_i1.p1  ORF type:complete len:227 (+),score=31.63 TRINITY_DN1368_c0_g1_i1:66-683(+)